MAVLGTAGRARLYTRSPSGFWLAIWLFLSNPYWTALPVVSKPHRMTDDVIPAESRDFLLTQIDSITQLEGLLWLRAQAGNAWDAAAIARQLYISEAEAVETLDRLVLRGLIAVGNAAAPRRYIYGPATVELDGVVGQVADLYREHLIPVTHLIHTKPKTSVQAFAEAFRLRKDKP